MTVTAIRSTTPVTLTQAPAATQAAPHAGDLRNCTAPLQVANEDQLKMATQCGGLVGAEVSATLDPMFWNWLNFITPAFIAQCYVDAVLVSGRYSSGAANSVSLIKESGAMANMSEKDLSEFKEQSDYAQAKLKEVEKRQETYQPKCFSSRDGIKRKEVKEYKEKTGCDLRTDLSVYYAGKAFAEKLLGIGSLPTFEDSQKELHALIAAQPKNAATIVIALNRLCRAWGR